MKTENLEWLVSNALHGDISGDNSNDLQVMIKAEQEFHALLASHNALVDAVKLMLYIDTPENFEGGKHIKARAEVDRILSEEK